MLGLNLAPRRTLSFRTRLVAGSAAALLAASTIPSLQAALDLPQQLDTADISPSYGGTMKLAEAFIRAGKFFDLIVLPGMTHEIHGIDRDYYFDAEAMYLVRHLIGRVR